jgi:hypothetical protein
VVELTALALIVTPFLASPFLELLTDLDLLLYVQPIYAGGD